MRSNENPGRRNTFIGQFDVVLNARFLTKRAMWLECSGRGRGCIDAIVSWKIPNEAGPFQVD